MASKRGSQGMVVVSRSVDWLSELEAGRREQLVGILHNAATFIEYRSYSEHNEIISAGVLIFEHDANGNLTDDEVLNIPGMH